jgi:hypothetical protein
MFYRILSDLKKAKVLKPYFKVSTHRVVKKKIKLFQEAADNTIAK